MKVEELRIGNLLRDNISKTELKVVELTEKDIITYVIDREMFPLKDGWGIEPIPLTEECLVKFGFDDRLHGWWSETIFLRNDENDYYYWFDWNGTNESKGVHIKHVHQLQNLYWCLCGKELEIIT